MKLPGSRSDVVRTKNVSGPSPVGGATGGTESRQVFTLDEFELQAAHYNMACAHARLQRSEEVRVGVKKEKESERREWRTSVFYVFLFSFLTRILSQNCYFHYYYYTV